jgi:hypothetical protein
MVGLRVAHLLHQVEEGVLVLSPPVLIKAARAAWRHVACEENAAGSQRHPIQMLDERQSCTDRAWAWAVLIVCMNEAERYG